MEQLEQPSRFQRCIFWAYHHGSAFKYMLLRLVRPAGLLVLIFAPLPWVLLPLHNQASVWQLRALLFALPLVSISWVFFRKGSVTASRDTPHLATAGEAITYKVSIHNKGKAILRGATLIETAHDNRPSLSVFCSSKEPNEASRNLFDRKFNYYRWLWLQRILTSYDVKTSEPLPALKPDATTNIDITLTPLKRGIIELTDIRLCLHDPLGLFQRFRKMPSSHDKIIVLPRRYSIPQLLLSGNARFQTGGDTASSSVGQSGDFTSIRDYKPGDAIKHIHWKSWARTGKPIIKEYEDVLFPRYGLVLDTISTAEHSDIFEAAVSIAASFSTTIDTQQSLLDLMFINDDAFTFSTGRGEEKVANILEVLASVTFSPDKNFTSLHKLISKHQKDLSACICIFTGWCEQRCDMITRLHLENLNLHIIVVCSELSEVQEIHKLHPSPTRLHWIRQSHLQQDLQNMTVQ